MDKDLIKNWMQRVDKTPVDIAAALHMSPQTIQRYLDGKSVLRSTRYAIEHFLKDEMKEEVSPDPEAA